MRVSDFSIYETCLVKHYLGGTDTVGGRAGICEHAISIRPLLSDSFFHDVAFRSDPAPPGDTEESTGGRRCCHWERAASDFRGSHAAAVRRCSVQGSVEVETRRAPW
jgi:hypothetical protein